MLLFLSESCSCSYLEVFTHNREESVGCFLLFLYHITLFECHAFIYCVKIIVCIILWDLICTLWSLFFRLPLIIYSLFPLEAKCWTLNNLWFSWDIHVCTHFMCFNTLRLRQNGRHFPDDIFKCIFLNENVWISLKISLKFVLKGLINNIPALVQIMTWRWPGDKPLSETMMAYVLDAYMRHSASMS